MIPWLQAGPWEPRVSQGLRALPPAQPQWWRCGAGPTLGGDGTCSGKRSLSSFSTGGELAFLKSTCIFKPFIFHCTESLNIPACVLLVLPSVGAEGIYSVSHSGNGGG